MSDGAFFKAASTTGSAKNQHETFNQKGLLGISSELKIEGLKSKACYSI